MRQGRAGRARRVVLPARHRHPPRLRARLGGLSALIRPFSRRRGWEATLLALFYAVAAWVVMHVAIALTSSSHPDDLGPGLVIGGFRCHILPAVPLAPVAKRRLG